MEHILPVEALLNKCHDFVFIITLTVDLQRQSAYLWANDIGKAKSGNAKKKLTQRSSE